MENLSTVAIVAVSDDVPVSNFTLELMHSLNAIGKQCVFLIMRPIHMSHTCIAHEIIAPKDLHVHDAHFQFPWINQIEFILATDFTGLCTLAIS